MRYSTSKLLIAPGLIGLAVSSASAQDLPQSPTPAPANEARDFRADRSPASEVLVERSGVERFDLFTPTDDPIRHRIDYANWERVLKSITIPMGPSTRQRARGEATFVGTRIRQGHNSPYRFEGSMVIFNFLLEADVDEVFTEYRRELEEVSNTLDIASLPRNEQLAFWFNLHNAAMLERIALDWPIRQPREIEIDGVPLDDAKFLTIRGVAMSLRDIRENIVFRNWKSPKVIYGFWRGEIGGPALESTAYTGANVGSLLDAAAADFVNSLRGTQKRGSSLEVSTLFEEARPFYFKDFENDVRAHIAQYAEADVAEILAETRTVNASIRERDIADVSGGKRLANYLFVSSNVNPMLNDRSAPSSRVPVPMWAYFEARRRKLENMDRRDQPTGRVIFSNIALPGDPPNKNAVE